MRQPRIKPELAPYRIGDGRVRIGGLTYGIGAEVKDPDGSVWTLLQSMDGSRSVSEIVQRVLQRYPAESADTVRSALQKFVDAGYVEDAGAPMPTELTAQDRERYDRSLAYFRWVDRNPRAGSWDPQVALLRARVTVVGVGGTGGVAALALAASGVGRIHCVDSDIVELSNLNRQVLYTEQDIGKPKAEVAVGRLKQLNSAIDITGAQYPIIGIEDLLPLAEDCDVLVLSADRPPDVRVWTNRACLTTGTPWVDAGYHGPQVQIGIYRPGQGACLECLNRTDEDRRRALGAHLTDATLMNAAVANAVGAPSAGISGYLAAHFALALVTGAPPPPAGRVHAVNLMALDAPFALEDPRVPDCPACGDQDSA